VSKSKIATVDEYLSGVSADKRAALERLRRTIRSIVPRAEECISYQLPAFRLDGKVLVWFGAGANHCAFYPGGLVAEFQRELQAYDTSKGTIRFQPDDPLPASLVRQVVKARMARIGAGRQRRKAARRPRR
jgi:uncharacterized protein YdhG (YjbR/CyaY superfamily)